MLSALHIPFKLFLVLFLISGVFASGVMSETCFCGEACPHVFQKNVNKIFSFPFHNHCVGTPCKGCSLEDGQTLKARNSLNRTDSLKLSATSFHISILIPYYSDKPVFRGLNPHFSAFEKFPPPAVFLQNCALLY